MIRKYHNHKPQTTPWHHEEELLNHHETPERQIKQSNQLSLPNQDECNTRITGWKRTRDIAPKWAHVYTELGKKHTTKVRKSGISPI